MENVWRSAFRRRASGVALITALLLSLAGRPARAGDCDTAKAGCEDWSGFIAFFYGSIAAGVVAGGGGLTIVAGNGHAIAKGHHPGQGWIVMGYIFSGLNTAMSIFCLATFARMEPRLGVPVGLTMLGIGALDLGLTIKASRLPRAPELRVSLVPQLGRDDGGRPIFGAGIRVAGF
jgi:hypothetical protein